MPVTPGNTLALGLMSGTSADGVSLALVRVDSKHLKVLGHETYPYPKALRGRILCAADAHAPELCALNFDLGRIFAQAAEKFLKHHRLNPQRLFVIGSHGQTIIHLPEGPRPSTLQLGEPSFLAESLGVPVVSDFRPRDMAAGGQGAPLAPFLDEFLFGHGPARALQNIGGIGNVTLAGRNIPTLGFDTGPGNCLIDLMVRKMTRNKQAFDQDGRLARRGKADIGKAEALLRLPYFQRRPPKSLDRSEFGESFLSRHFSKEICSRPLDCVATLTYFTALTIADAYLRFILPEADVREAVLSGGGALNPVLMKHLKTLLSPIQVRSIAEFNIHPLAKEPAAFALMALRAVQSKTNHSPRATGAAGPRILGKITP